MARKNEIISDIPREPFNERSTYPPIKKSVYTSFSASSSCWGAERIPEVEWRGRKYRCYLESSINGINVYNGYYRSEDDDGLVRCSNCFGDKFKINIPDTLYECRTVCLFCGHKDTVYDG